MGLRLGCSWLEGGPIAAFGALSGPCPPGPVILHCSPLKFLESAHRLPFIVCPWVRHTGPEGHANHRQGQAELRSFPKRGGRLSFQGKDPPLRSPFPRAQLQEGNTVFCSRDRSKRLCLSLSSGGCSPRWALRPSEAETQSLPGFRPAAATAEFPSASKRRLQTALEITRQTGWV